MRPRQTTAGAPGAWARAGGGGPADDPPVRPRRTELLEVVTPRTNAAALTPAENLLAAGRPRRVVLARGGRHGAPALVPRPRRRTPATARHLREQLGGRLPPGRPAPAGHRRRRPGATRPAGRPASASPPAPWCCAARPTCPCAPSPSRTSRPTGPATPPRPTPCWGSSAPWAPCRRAGGPWPSSSCAPPRTAGRGPTCAWPSSTPWPPSGPRRRSARAAPAPRRPGVLAPAALLGAGALALHARRLWAAGRWPELALPGRGRRRRRGRPPRPGSGSSGA